MATTPPSQPAPGLTRTASVAQQISWQRRAAARLAEILEWAAAGDLPPIAWTVQRAGAVLVGHCYATEPGERRREFGVWRDVITRRAGRGPDIEREHTDSSSGTVRLTSHWEHWERVSVTLVADIYPEDDGS
jgi:hypothetical protein